MNFLEERIAKDGIVKGRQRLKGRQLPESSDGYSPVR